MDQFASQLLNNGNDTEMVKCATNLKIPSVHVVNRILLIILFDSAI